MPELLLTDGGHATGSPFALIVSALFAVSNLAITGGYLSIPWLVLPHLSMPADTRVMGIGFFGLCGTTHFGMGLAGLMYGPAAVAHVPGVDGAAAMVLAVVWTVIHVAQAVCTWGFILKFRRDLRRALARAVELEARLRPEPVPAGGAAPANGAGPGLAGAPS